MAWTSRSVSVMGLCACLTVAAAPAHSGVIPLNQFLEFSFFDAGQPAAGCAPADPGGDFCVPGSGTQFLNAPPWTFVAPLGGATLIVTDAFTAGDRFQVFDFGVSIGLTSAPIGAGSCGSDPVTCLANANISHGVFALAAGAHSLTLTAILAPTGGGAGYLQAQVAQIPEPSLSALLTAGLLALYGWRSRARRK